MDEDASSYTERCAVCQDVNWGITGEKRFYCKSCNTVIDKVLECIDPSGFFDGTAKVITLSRGIRGSEKSERSNKWYRCEGFQMVLCMQADALQALGVSARLKDDVLLHMWRRYLQRTAKAYVEPGKSNSPARPASMSLVDNNSEPNMDPIDLEMTSLSSFSTCSWQSDGTSGISDGVDSGEDFKSKRGSVDGKLQVHSGHVDVLHLSLTLAFCHLGLMWLRQAPTLLDLMRLVRCGTVPYANAFEGFPDEMKIGGQDARFFRPIHLPRYSLVLHESQLLAEFLALPRFPEVTERSVVHPHALTASFLHCLNLPDLLLPWCCWVMAVPGLLRPSRLTYDPMTAQGRATLQLELVAVASILVALKLLLVLDDHTEWKISKAVRKLSTKRGERWFRFGAWCRAVTNLAARERDAELRIASRRSWVQSRQFCYSSSSHQSKSKMKQKLARDLEDQVRRSLISVEQREALRAPGANSAPLFHGDAVVGVMDKRLVRRAVTGGRYWKTPREPENPELPHSFRFVLEVTATLLGAEQGDLLREVRCLEKKLLLALRAPPRRR